METVEQRKDVARLRDESIFVPLRLLLAKPGHDPSHARWHGARRLGRDREVGRTGSRTSQSSDSDGPGHCARRD